MVWLHYAVHGHPLPQSIEWLAHQPFQYFVMSKGGTVATAHSIPVNRGDEIVLYAKFLVDNYDRLPARMVFAHAHDQSWHQRVRVSCVVCVSCVCRVCVVCRVSCVMCRVCVCACVRVCVCRVSCVVCRVSCAHWCM